MPSLLHFRVPGPGLPTFGPQTSSPGFLLVCVLYSGRMAHAPQFSLPKDLLKTEVQSTEDSTCP